MLVGGLAPIAAAPVAAAADPPASPFECAAEADGGPSQATIDDFVGKWLPRVTDQPGAWSALGVAGLDSFQNFMDQVGFPARTNPPIPAALVNAGMADRAVREWPTAILDEGFHHPVFPENFAAGQYPGVTNQVAACLVNKLDDALRNDPTAGGPYGAANPDLDKARGSLFGLILDRSWRLHLEPVSPTATPTGTQPLPSFGQVLDLLKLPDTVSSILAGIPRVALPSNLVPPVGNPLDLTALINALKLPLINPLALPSLPSLVPQIPITFPTLNLPITSLLTTTQRVIDSTTYRICYESPKLLTPTCSPDIPLNTPWPVDLDNNVVPDAIAQLSLPALPSVVGFDISASFSLKRLPLVSTGNLPGTVVAIFEAPTNDVRLAVGLGAKADSTIANSATATFTIKNVLKSIQGPLTVDAKITHTKPGPSNLVVFGATDLLRDPNPTKPAVQRDQVGATINFLPAPAQTSVVNPGPNERIDMHAVLTSDLNKDGKGGDSQTDVTLTMPSARPVTIDAVTRTPSAFDAANPKPAKCCPQQVINASFENFPSKTQVILTQDQANRTTDVVYHASSKIDHASVNAYDYPIGGDPAKDEEWPDAESAKTYTQRVIDAYSIPKDVHISIQAPDASTTKLTKVHYDASDKLGKIAFQQRHVRREPTFGATQLVDETTGSVELLPTVIDLSLTQKESLFGPAPQRTQNDTDVVYEANGPTGKVAAELRDEGVTDPTAAPMGARLTADSIPPYVTVHMGKATPKPLVGSDGDLNVAVDSRLSKNASPFSGSFGNVTAEYRSNAQDYLTPDQIGQLLTAAGTPMGPDDQFVAVQAALLPGNKTSTRAAAHLSSLAGLGATTTEHVKDVSDIVLDLDKGAQTPRLYVGFQTDALIVRGVIDSIPKHVHIERTVSKYDTGDENDARAYVTQHVGFSSCDRTLTGCVPVGIGHAHVQVTGRVLGGKPFSSDELLDADIDQLASSVNVDLTSPPEKPGDNEPPLAGTPPTDTTVNYTAGGFVKSVDVNLRKRVEGFDPLIMQAHARIDEIPQQFLLDLGPEGKVDFISPDPIKRIDAIVSNGFSGNPPRPNDPHAWVTMLDKVNPDGSPRSGQALDASLILNGVMQFRLRPKGGDINLGTVANPDIVPCPGETTCAVLKTANTAVLNPNFSVRADVGFADSALRANLRLGELPDLIVFKKDPAGALAIDTTKSTKVQTPVFLNLASATTANAARSVVTDGTSSEAPMAGVEITDHATSDAEPATRVRARLGMLPRLIRLNPKSFIEKFEPAIPPNEALAVQGFAGSEDASVSGPHTFRTIVNLDDCPQGTSTNDCAGGRILADINMGSIPATGMSLTLRPIKTVKGLKVSGAGQNLQLSSTMHMIIGVDSSTSVSPLSLEVHSGTDLNAVDNNSVPAGKPLTEAVIKARIDKLPAKTNLDINLDKNLSFGGDFHDQNGADDTPGKVTITYSDVNDQHGNSFQDKPRTNPLVDMVLGDVPTTFNFLVEPQAVIPPDSSGITNCVIDPETGAYGAEVKKPLPKITYTASGTNASSLDIFGNNDPRGALLRLSELSALTQAEANAGQFPSPDVVFKIDNLGADFSFVNNKTNDDNKFDLTSTPPTGSINVYVDGFKSNLINLDTHCLPPLDLGFIKFTLEGQFAVDLATDIALTINGHGTTGTQTTHLDPGLNTGVHGTNVDSVSLTLGTPTAQPELIFRSTGFDIKVHYDFGLIDGDFTVPLIPPFNADIGFTPRFHVYDHLQEGQFVAIYTPIWCGLTSDLDSKWLVGKLNAHPKRVDVRDGGFTMLGNSNGDLVGSATLDVLALLGLPSGIDSPVAFDFIDGATQLFLAKESPKGLGGPGVDCQS